MGYSDQKFYARPLELVVANVGFGTATASGTNTLASPAGNPLPVYARKTSIGNVEVVVTTAVPVGSVVATLVFLNGTSTFATVAMTGGTATAGQAFKGVMTPANSTFGTQAGPTYELIVNTATVSGAATGAFQIFFEQQEIFTAP